MRHHAYFIVGDVEEGIVTASAWVKKELHMDVAGNPDVTILRYGLFSVEEARTFQDAVMRAPVQGTTKVIIVSATRFFYQAQNALLKTFEEPPPGTYLILILPAEGVLLPTLRSRLVSLQGASSKESERVASAQTFLNESKEGREKFISKLLDRTKSDNDDEKARARHEATALLEGLMRLAYRKEQETPSAELRAFLSDLDRFMPMMHDTSTPLKLIFEHILLTIPRELK